MKMCNTGKIVRLLKNYWEGRRAGHCMNVGNFHAGQPTGFIKCIIRMLWISGRLKLTRTTKYSLYTIIHKDIRSLRFFVVSILFVTFKKWKMGQQGKT